LRQPEGSVFGIGMSEMLVIVGVALLVFGPQELPQLAKKIARGMREVRRASDDLRRSIDLDDEAPDHRFRRPPPDPRPTEAPHPELTGSIPGSLLTEPVEPVEPGPVIVPVAAVAVGSELNDATTTTTPASSSSLPLPSSPSAVTTSAPAPAPSSSSATESGRG
jgi:Tat protein translocase TatB subunit